MFPAGTKLPYVTLSAGDIGRLNLGGLEFLRVFLLERLGLLELIDLAREITVLVAKGLSYLLGRGSDDFAEGQAFIFMVPTLLVRVRLCSLLAEL